MKALIIFTFLFAPAVVAADDTAAKPTKLSAADLQVVAHYHALNVMEVDLGKTALKRGTVAIKSYAQMLVKDHGDSDVKLKALAKKTGQLIPREKLTDAEKKELADTKKQAAALKKLRGSAFDREYLRMMVDGHEKELAKADAKLAAIEHSELADMMKNKKETLQHHADGARELQKSNAAAMR